MFLEGIVIIISLVVSIRSTLLQVMTKIPVQNDIIIIIPIYNFRVDTQDMGEKKRSSTKGRLKKWEDFYCRDLRKETEDGWFECVGMCARMCMCACGRAGSFKGPNITQIKTCILLFMGSLFVPVSSKQLCVCVCVRGEGGSEKESFNNLVTNICIPQSTGVLFFALFYLSTEKQWGGKKLVAPKKMCICVFVCCDLCA